MNQTNAMTTVTCPRCHGFDNAFTRFGHIASGKCLTEIGQRDLQCFPVRVQQGRVQLQLPITKAGA
jgi:nitrite reductase/ring-hydroxylating ferredoxin subunit